jgi:hypothetical protein
MFALKASGILPAGEEKQKKKENRKLSNDKV